MGSRSHATCLFGLSRYFNPATKQPRFHKDEVQDSTSSNGENKRKKPQGATSCCFQSTWVVSNPQPLCFQVAAAKPGGTWTSSSLGPSWGHHQSPVGLLEKAIKTSPRLLKGGEMHEWEASENLNKAWICLKTPEKKAFVPKGILKDLLARPKINKSPEKQETIPTATKLACFANPTRRVLWRSRRLPWSEVPGSGCGWLPEVTWSLKKGGLALVFTKVPVGFDPLTPQKAWFVELWEWAPKGSNQISLVAIWSYTTLNHLKHFTLLHLPTIDVPNNLEFSKVIPCSQ